MNSKRRKLLHSMALVGLLLPAYSMILSAFKNRELQLFFSEDLEWARTFADNDFDFCKFEVWRPSDRIKLEDEFLFTSPKQRFSLREEEASIANFSNTKIVDLISKKVALVFPHNSGSSEVKWDP